MNVLLSRPDRVGDAVITTALIPVLRATPAIRRVAWLGRENLRTLIAPKVDAFVAVESPDAVEQLRALGLDASLHLNPDPIAARLAREAGIARRIGYVAESPELTLAVDDPRPAGDRHEIEAAHALASRLLDIPSPTGPWRAQIQIAPRSDLLPAGTRSLALHIGASPGKARLPETLLLAVAHAWQQEPTGHVLLLGAGDEQEPAARLAAGLAPDRTHNLCGTLTLPELAGVAGAATVFLGRDSGPAHLAAAAGGRTVVIFPAARADMSVARWHPLGERVTVIECAGRARWWEKTERASTRLFAALDPTAVITALRQAAAGR